MVFFVIRHWALAANMIMYSGKQELWRVYKFGLNGIINMNEQWGE